MPLPEIVLRLPPWVEAWLPPAGGLFPAAEDRMRLVIGLSRANIEHGTGGPFGAAVFEQATGRLIAAGVNLVLASNCCVAHAEVVAIALAQRALGHYDLGAEGLPACELVASTEPCVMCQGALHWSGVRSLVCGARDEDARSIGFDEGAKAPGWAQALEARGIAVTRDVLRDEARAVLQLYRDTGGVIYNARQGAAAGD